MASEPEDLDWQPSNYFNYFTEVEDHFRHARGTGLWLMSTLDWALVEGWKNAGIPLEAVLRGIEIAFEKWRSKKSKLRMINSVAYCTQSVMTEAEVMAGTAAAQKHREVSAPFGLDELRAYMVRNAGELRKIEGYDEMAAKLDQLTSDLETHYADLEALEQRLSALEDKMAAIAATRQSEEDLFVARRELDTQLRQYRSRMSAEQIAMLERQFLARRLFESAGLPRLSLFYLHP